MATSASMTWPWPSARPSWARSSQPAGLRPEPLLDGADLIVMGYRPGPVFKEILTAVEDEQLEGRLADKNEAQAFVRLQASKPRSSRTSR